MALGVPPGTVQAATPALVVQHHRPQLAVVMPAHDAMRSQILINHDAFSFPWARKAKRCMLTVVLRREGVTVLSLQFQWQT